MTGVGMVLKALGVNVTEQHVRMIEALIPQIPGKINEFVVAFNAALQDNRDRLTRIEEHEKTSAELLVQVALSMSALDERLARCERIIDELQQPGRNTDDGKRTKPNGADRSHTRSADRSGRDSR
jgi:hypothetical protein